MLVNNFYFQIVDNGWVDSTEAVHFSGEEVMLVDNGWADSTEEVHFSGEEVMLVDNPVLIHFLLLFFIFYKSLFNLTEELHFFW